MNRRYNLCFFFLIFVFCVFNVNLEEAYGASASVPESIKLVLEKVLSTYPDLLYRAPDIDTGWKPEKERSILWVCSKKDHLFLGIDRRNGVLFLVSSVATGRNPGQKSKVGDMRTPEGKFAISQIQDASWWKPYEDKKTGEKIGYGPFFIRLDTGKWKGIGIHGTDDGHISEIGTNASHGCLRLKNEDLIKVVEYSMTGQEVLILP